MTTRDALAVEEHDARVALLTRLDELGALLIQAHALALQQQPLPTTALRVKAIAVEEAADIVDAIHTAALRAQ